MRLILCLVMYWREMRSISSMDGDPSVTMYSGSSDSSLAASSTWSSSTRDSRRGDFSLALSMPVFIEMANLAYSVSEFSRLKIRPASPRSAPLTNS